MSDAVNMAGGGGTRPSQTQLTLQRDGILPAVLRGCSLQIRLLVSVVSPYPSPFQRRTINITHFEESLSSEFHLSVGSWDKNSLAEVTWGIISQQEAEISGEACVLETLPMLFGGQTLFCIVGRSLHFPLLFPPVTHFTPNNHLF